MTIDQVLEEIQERMDNASENMEDAIESAGHNSPGFNQSLGEHDGLMYLKEWIEENRDIGKD